MARILMVASEAAPFAKTGGLADVIGSLPAALVSRGEEVAVVMPRYRGISISGVRRAYDDLRVWLGPDSYVCNVYQVVERGVTFNLVDCPPLFDRDGLYGDSTGDYPDNAIRFAVLSHAALVLVRHLWRPDVIHCHDWQSALVPVYARHFFSLDPTFYGIPILFTIHNMGYQGIFPAEALKDIGLDRTALSTDRLEFFGKINLMKGALILSEGLSTVSKGYAREIQTPELGFGLDHILRSRADRLTGILNGVDYSEWNPESDRFIAAHYSDKDLSGKEQCKLDLLAELGLPSETAARPVIGIISRFVNHKGFDLISEVAEEIIREGAALAVLGTGEPHYEEMFRGLAAAHPGRVGVRIAYDNPLAHKIEAGSDMFLMPSMYEPCGLNQIYSLRYGTVPVVRATGGLDDTIDESTGFKFEEYSGRALLETIRRALAAFGDRGEWQELMRRGMRKDFSWNASAAEYSALYRRLAG